VDGYGLHALIFAREVSDPLIGLVKAIDRQLEESSSRRKGQDRLGVFVIFCSDDPGLPQRLQDVIAREGVKHVVFSVSKNKAQGPPRYRVAREAEMTVVIYSEQERVVANYALAGVDLTADREKDILASLKKVLP
jgi:hypothetical protein